MAAAHRPGETNQTPLGTIRGGGSEFCTLECGSGKHQHSTRGRQIPQAAPRKREGVSHGPRRAKAKQTKVARELKYSSPSTDFDSLQRELSNGGASGSPRNGGVIADKRADEDSRSRWDEDDYDDWRR
ncbi:DUF3073 family protein [Rhodococcus hoagii]|nr:DUF3073 family protein [Prescottella equi]